MQPTVIKEYESFTICCVIYLATISVCRQYFVNGMRMNMHAEHWRNDIGREHGSTTKNPRSNATLSVCVCVCVYV